MATGTLTLPLMTGDGTATAVVSLLDDEYARTILVCTHADAMSAEELSEACDAAPSTVYSRLERLHEHDLVTERQAIDPGGHHYKTYRARLDRVTIDLTDEGLIIEVERVSRDPADRFTGLVEGLRR